jgi:AraC-like DNA-binding protein
MKETLSLPRGLDGWVWRYRSANYDLRVHHHDELELNLVTSGQARYLVGDRRYDLRRNTQIWLFPGQGHVLLDQSNDYEMWIAVFRPAMLRRACTSEQARVLRKSDPEGHFSRQLPERAARRLEGLFADLAAARSERDRFNLGISYALLTAWSAHLSAEQLTDVQDLHPAIERAAAIIRDEVEDEPLALPQIARRAGLSPSRLSRLFKSQTGVSLVQYRQRICLQRFLRLYGDGTDQNIMQLALQSGFGSYPQFHRVFKQTMGCSPGEYHRHESRGA